MSQVFETTAAVEARKERVANGRPSHWVNDQGTGFHNPWPSWRYHDFQDWKYILFKQQQLTPPVPKDIDTLIPVHKPTWGSEKEDARDSIKVTWLGHAACLAEFPARTVDGNPSPSRGIRILFDPAMSDRCSPFQWAGPKRFTRVPCDVTEIPTIDAVVISHDHYDHLDENSIKSIAKRQPPPHFFAPRGNGPWFRSLGIPESHTHILDWWDSRRLQVEVDKGNKVEVDITCTPCQHFSGRSITDHFKPASLKTLWASWAVEQVVSSGEPKKLWFGGDTGYRAVLDDQPEDEAATCPVFKEIGQKFGYFDVALIPIGAYLGRRFMSPIHCAPQDSVRVFQDVKAKRALGIHWGAWQLTHEDVDEPPRKLAEEAKKLGLEQDAFITCEIGQTLFF